MNEERPVGRNVDDIDAKLPKPSFDPDMYEGKRVKIERVEEMEVTDFYTGENGAYNPKSTEKKHIIEIETEPLPKLDKDGNTTKELYTYFDDVAGVEKTITVTVRLGLKFDKEKNDWIISKHPKADLWKFMRKLGVEKLSQVRGKFVTLLAKPSTNPEDDRKFLRIAI